MNLERKHSQRKPDYHVDMENPPSNRFRDWYNLVPQNIRRIYAYDAWKGHQHDKIAQKVARGTKVGDPKEEAKLFKAEYKRWEEGILRGKEGRAEMERRVGVAKRHFNEWLQLATGEEVDKNAVSYAVLWGSSFFAPRKSSETDLDIGILLKNGKEISRKYLGSDAMWGIHPHSIDVAGPDYAGKVDFFIHKPIPGTVSFIFSPHAAIYHDPVFTEHDLRVCIDAEIRVIQGDIDSISGKGKVSQVDLKAMVERCIAELRSLSTQEKKDSV